MEVMLTSFYRILVESVLTHNSVQKEDIEQIEAIRQKYRISLADHLNVLANIEDGVHLYTKYLAEFGIMNVSFMSCLTHSLERLP